MIIADLYGGLGNQMFQYACARALSVELELPLKVTLDMFGCYRLHYGPELDRVFSLKLEVAMEGELERMIGWLRAFPRVRRALSSKVLAPVRGSRFIAEPHFHYWDGLVGRARAGGYLRGYWQSERYFVKHADVVRTDFSFRRPLAGQNADLGRNILSSVAVSIHVRRGDYVRKAGTVAVHGTCPAGYYFKAIESLGRRVPGVRLFAFSDVPQWVAEVLKPRYPDLLVVDQNRGENSHNDMRLMSLCRHHIISNSTFSWWGAWLNSRPDKIVIAPQRWFAGSLDTGDLVPSTWERM